MDLAPAIAALQTSLQAHALFTDVDALYERVSQRSDERYRHWAPSIARRSFLAGARNLAAYLAFREDDLRGLQDRLIPLGLSSLGRCESHVIASVAAVRATLGALSGATDAAAQRPRSRDFALGDELLRHNTHAIFGPAPADRPHIMVTLGSDAATDPAAVCRLIEAGMDTARINCAHDDPQAWRAMAENVRHAARETQRPCRVYMDIAGPKIRVAAVHTHKRGHRFIVGDTLKLSCTETSIYEQLRPGAPVWIDDGKLGAVVVDVGPGTMLLKITRAGKSGRKIRPDSGLNFPTTHLALPALSEKDLADLDHIVASADIVGQSFVRSAADVELLLQELERRSVRLPIVAKIETAEGIANLPEIIVAGASSAAFGIMIARGDLALEIGYPRLAEMQEEVLWLCEAAHIPVIWATQVLDQFAKTGIPTRAEMTDAAMAERAECVMLNKGPFIVEAVAILGNVLDRMHGHQAKKSARLRALHAWTVDPAPTGVASVTS